MPGDYMNKGKIVLVVFFFSFLFSFEFIIEKENYDNNNVEVTLENRKESYKVGSLEIDDTNFKKNLVQTSNNTFFLNHDEVGNISKVGSVFLDYRNKLTDKKLLIYAHNSRNLEDAPFHFLENYLDFNFGKKYNKLILETDGGFFYYQLFTVIIITDDFQHINLNWSLEGYANHLAWLKSNSKFDYSIDISGSDSIILFQTCYYEPENSYLLVGWKKMP